MPNRVVLFSGGPDSFITYKYLQDRLGTNNKNTLALYLNLNHRYLLEEVDAVRTCASLLGLSVAHSNVLRGLGDTEESDSYIHHRNAYLCLAASKYLEGDGLIFLTIQKDELSISDRTQDFLDKMSSLLYTLSGHYVAVATPWIDKDKTEMVSWFLESGGNPEDLKKTWSCYSPINHRQCGNCPACFRRWTSFILNGIKEEYMTDPANSLTAAVYEKKAVNREYSDSRCDRILSALRIGRSI